MKFGEEYAYTMYTNLETSIPLIFYNNYNGRLIGGSSSLDDLSDQALTSRPYATPIRCDAKFNFIPLWPLTADTFNVRIRKYDHAGVEGPNLLFPITPEANTLIIINPARGVLNAIDTNYINDGVKYYTVEFDTPNRLDHSIYRFDLNCECTYDQYTLHFLNKYGGFESKDFTKVSRKTIDIEKKDFGRLPYTVDVSGVVSYRSSNGVYNETRSVYSSQYKEKMVLNSDLLTDAEYRWLQELVLSPMVYMEEDEFFFPVVITENNYEPKRIVNDQLTNLTISIEFGDQLNAQYR